MANPAALPFTEAIDFYKAKIKLPSSGWTDIWQEQHSHSFVVAGAAHDDLVSDFYNAVAKAKEAGGYAEFQKAFPEIVKKHGWAHNGSPGWRSKIIYDMNITQAYNAGNYQQMMAIKHLQPYWQYKHTSIEHPRLAHKAWNGLILSADDPWWNTHYPQNGWGCKCRVYTLTRTQANREFEKHGKSGPDKAPPIEMEERVVGKNGSNPRTVLVPKGIDPGFAYNPGKAWLEPHTLPPLQGYDAVLKERKAVWPTKDDRPPLPTPTKLPASYVLPAGTAPEVAVSDFLYVFKATLDKGAAYTDKAGSTLAISKALFIKGGDKDGDNFKWLAEPEKADRLKYINLLARTLFEPDEIWWAWEKDSGDPAKWRLKRRYVKSFEIDGDSRYGVGVFEWSKAGWTGATVFPASKDKYFDKQRVGRLVWKK